MTRERRPPRIRRPTGVQLAAVAAGGAAGASARWLLGEWAPDGSGFPWTTFAINVAGSFLLAVLPVWPAIGRHPPLALACGPGLLGGFTTLSAYSEQARALVAVGERATALAYLIGTLAACLLVVHLGRALIIRPPEGAR